MMDVLYLFLAGLAGLGVGSLVNIVIFRRNDGRELFGRSRCRVCQEPLALLDMIPLLGFFRLRGKCRSCSLPISWQYPILELLTGILFMVLFSRAYFGFWMPSFVGSGEWFLLFLRDASLFPFLLIIAVYDFRYFRILDRYSLIAVVIAILWNIALGMPALSMMAGMAVLGGFFGIQYVISKGAWMGGGDIRLGLVLGAYLGLEVGLVAVFLSYLVGAIVGGVLLFLKKRTLHSAVPFGAFLTTSAIFCALYGEVIWNWYRMLTF
ncbi:MAG: prepilin peptidase [Patescibacteria group bacterium]|jgi:prepilin signal peptidase PulO-like enzyme (type II secretory pathway)